MPLYYVEVRVWIKDAWHWGLYTRQSYTSARADAIIRTIESDVRLHGGNIYMRKVEVAPI